MELIDAEKLLISKLKEHNLEGWSVVFDNDYDAIGKCDLTTQRIHLSKQFIRYNKKTRVKITVLHEIAHALTPKGAHGIKWREKCIEIGGDGIAQWGLHNTKMPPLRMYQSLFIKLDRLRDILRKKLGIT